MRQWIALFEVKKSDGVWKNPSAREIAILVKDNDMRGVAFGNDVWFDYAHNDVHYGIRNRLGLPGDSYAGGGEEEDGFNFYVCAPHVPYEFDPDADTDQDFRGQNGGRNDWVSVGNRTPDFTVDGAIVYIDCHKPVALSNKAFARLVGKPSNQERIVNDDPRN